MKPYNKGLIGTAYESKTGMIGQIVGIDHLGRNVVEYADGTREAVDRFIGLRVTRDADSVPGAITTRDGDRYSIRWDDGSVGFVFADAIHSADAQQRSRQVSSVRNRAAEARACLEAIKTGTSVNAILERDGIRRNVAATSELTDADRAKILARLDAHGKKSPPPVSPSGTKKPASVPRSHPDASFQGNVAQHLDVLLKPKK